ncbi:MAG: MFS transporter, partial [Acidimicrobiales bacterium]
MGAGPPGLGDLEGWLRHEGERLSDAVGGPARLKVIVLLACVMGLQAADVATVGAAAVPLEAAFHITNTQVGLLVTVSTAIGAVATLPVGVMVDRLTRTRILAISILVWCAAELASAASQSYLWLLLTRLALGAVVATASPSVASLTGDLFKVSERARIYGYILTGELVGAGVGILVSGDLGGISWRASFAWLVIPGAVLAFVIWRFLPEPARGGQSRMAEGAETIPSAVDVALDNVPPGTVAEEDATESQGVVEEEVVDQGVEPRRGLVLERDPTGRNLWWAVRYVLAIPTNRRLIIGSALGYFYFQGLRTFAVEYLRGRFGLGQGAASSLLIVIGIGAIIGALVTGRVADRLVRVGLIPGRVLVAGVSFLVAVALLVPGLVTSSIAVAIPLFFVGAAGLGGSNSPLDAARLDIMPSGLWGRAESTRTFLRSIAQGVAPLAFGGVADLISGSTPHQAPVGTHTGQIVSGTGTGLQVSFLIMLVSL